MTLSDPDSCWQELLNVNLNNKFRSKDLYTIAFSEMMLELMLSELKFG